jgi:hypothetical protein
MLFVPMEAGKLKPHVERTYRESHALQWVREALINSQEAGATRVHFGIEWKGVEATGAYRRIIADDGMGILPTDHARFFNTFGSGSKPIGGVHENYGIGFKTSVLPWNRLGVAILSIRDGVESMSRICFNEKADEYGMLAQVSEEGELLTVWTPGPDSEFKLNWAEVIPNWVREAGHGTAIVLLGNQLSQDTIVGDPSRPAEANVDAIVNYINARFWQLSHIQVAVDVVMSVEKERWPEALAPKSGGGRSASWGTLRPVGMYRATVDRETKDSQLAHKGTVKIQNDQVQIDWYLRAGAPLPSTRAQSKGFVASLYRNELYGLQDHAATMRSFGLGAIRDQAFIVIRAPEYSGTGFGIYPDTSRTGLKIAGPDGGRDLPMSEWAQEFSSKLPKEIIDAIKASFANVNGKVTDNSWKERLQERFGQQWRIPKMIVKTSGAMTTTPVQAVGSSKTSNPLKRIVNKILHEGPTPNGSPKLGAEDPSGAPATEKSVAGGLPDYAVVGEDDIGENGRWALAAYQTPSAAEPAGKVLINRDHRVLKQHVAEICAKYPEHLGSVIEEELHRVYGEIAVAHVAHSEQMKKLLPAATVDKDFRSESALTMALLGLWQIEAVALPRLQGKLQQATTKPKK